MSLSWHANLNSCTSKFLTNSFKPSFKKMEKSLGNEEKTFKTTPSISRFSNLFGGK